MPKGHQSNRRRRLPSEQESTPTNDEGTPVLRAEDIEGFVSLEGRAVRVLALITQLFGKHSVSTNYGDGRGENSNEISLPLEGDRNVSVVVEAEHVPLDSTTPKDNNDDGHQHESEDQVKENLDNCDTLSSAKPTGATESTESTTIDRSDLCEQIPRHSPILPPPTPAPAPAAAQKRTRGSSNPKGFVAKKENKQSAPPRLPPSLSATAAAVTATAASSPPSSANPTPTSPATSAPSHDPNAESLPAPCPAPTTKRKGRPGRLRASKARRR
ncbi:MAG: hypothetical protein J3R72DRAFT_421672 [Linnemannia gamsii]|nr:MAG: hypothetical protein J3R72DRAFT_421672 [Linnemannia gamsii]